VKVASVAGVAAAIDAEVVLGEVPLHIALLAQVTGPELLLLPEQDPSEHAKPAVRSPLVTPTFWMRMFFLLGVWIQSESLQLNE
jgi:hypothetical protein